MIRYKIDVMEELKKKKITPKYIREKGLISEATLQNIRNKKPVTFQTLNTLCELLKKQPGQILEYIPDDKTESNQD